MQKIIGITLLLCFVLFSTGSLASTDKEIDQQLWKPFVKSWMTMDGKANAALHTKDIVRVMGQMGNISAGEEYLKMNTRMMGMMKIKGVTSTITFRFKSRINNEQYAWHKGVYRAVMNHPEKGEMINYAEFDVLLEKIDGRWKIKLDRDYPATEKEFQLLDDKSEI